MPKTGERTLRPFSDVLVIFAGEDGRLKLAAMYWQLIHYWEQEFKSRYTCFNTRADSLEKPHNRELLISKRCVLPAVSFFENRQTGGQTLKPRQVYEISLPGRRLMALGGIYSVWANPKDKKDKRLSCSIITVEPNPTVAEIHNRMPLIFPADQVSRWLDPGVADVGELKEMIKPFGDQIDTRQLI